MGARPSEQIEREIEELRVDTDRVLMELEGRFRDALNVRAQVERHPMASGTIGLALLGGLGLTAYAVYSAATHKESPGERTRERLEAAGEMTPGVVRPRAPEGERRAEGMVKKVFWTFLTTLLVAIAGFAARRLSTTLWTKTMREQPPK